MSARAAWEAERRRLAAEFRPHRDRPSEGGAWERYAAGARAAWRAFAAAEPDEAERLFAGSMLAVSRERAKAATAGSSDSSPRVPAIPDVSLGAGFSR